MVGQVPEINIVYEPVEANWGVDVGEVVPLSPEQLMLIAGVVGVGILAAFFLMKKR